MNKNTHDDKMSRLLAKYRLKIARGNEKGCNEFVFYIDKGFYGRDWEESRLDMSEETAAPILGVIAALYKFFMKWIHPHEWEFVDFWVSGP